MRRILLVTALTALAALPAQGQIAWESPAFISPVTPSGVSLFVLDREGELGAMATFRHDAGPVGLGYRLAVGNDGAPEPDDGIAISGGVDVSGFLARGLEGSEIDVVWWSGAGVGIGDETLVTVPAGIVLGWSGSEGEVVLSPYGGAHVNLDFWSGEGDAIRLTGVADLGLDLVLPSGWLFRFGATLGDRESLAVGVRLPT